MQKKEERITNDAADNDGYGGAVYDKENQGKRRTSHITCLIFPLLR